MNSSLALIDLLQRLAGNHGQEILVTKEELCQWSPVEVKALQTQGIVTKTRPASSALCPGCEEGCIKPVYRLTSSDNSALFVVCDNRDDTNRISIDTNILIQWRCAIEFICGFVVTCLGIHQSEKHGIEDMIFPLGTVSGNKRCHLIHLHVTAEILLKAGTSSIPLVDLVGFDGMVYSLNTIMIRQWIDASPAADNSYTPSNVRRESRKLDTQAMHEIWRKKYRQLKTEHPGMTDTWYSKKIAKLDIGNKRDSETIRKNMKK
jgi:hypothetical protein